MKDHFIFNILFVSNSPDEAVMDVGDDMIGMVKNQ